MTAILAVLSSWALLAYTLGYSIYIYQPGKHFDIAHGSEYGCEDARSNFYKSICISSIFIVISASINAIAYATIYRCSEMNGLRIISMVQLFTIISFLWAIEADVGLAKPCQFFASVMADASQIHIQ